MKNRLFITLLIAVLSCSAMRAAIGPQSVKVTFNGSDSEGWVIPEMTGSGQTTGTITSVEDGYVNITMGVQNAAENKYRADLQYNNSDDSFTFDRTKDVIWAIKLKADISGTGTNKKFELGFKDSGATKYTGHQGSQYTTGISCADGGKVYYFDLSSNSTITSASTEILTIEKIHFIFADAVIADEADAKYSVDWIATFQSVNDLTAFIDWTDEAQEADPSLPYYEALFRISYNGTYSYDNNYKKNGFKDTEFEGNYKANIFAIEYFLVDYHLEDIYTLTLHPSATNNAAISVWDFPHQETLLSSAETMYGYAQAITGLAPGSAEGTETTPITSATCVNSTWTLNIPAYKLTPLATVGTKTLVGIFVTTRDLTTNSGAKFAPSANTEKAHPSFTRSGTNPIVNLTQSTAAATLSEAVNAASAGDVIELRSDVTISGSRVDIGKELTIQGATGEEKLICSVGTGTIMLLANGSGDHDFVLKDLVIDGQNTSRSIQTVEAAGDAALYLDNVRFVNTSYSVITGDVKCNSNKEIYLKGNNSIPNGIYLNRDKRINNQYATHTSENPILIYLVGDYQENYAIVRLCNDATLYNIASSTDAHRWHIFVSAAGSERELKGTHIYPLTLSDNSDNSTTLSTNNGKHADVTLNRTIACNGNDYATFCAPFAISRDALEQQLGSTEVLRYKRTDIVGDEAVLVFDDGVTNLEAGVPYLIKPAGGSDVTSITFDDVIIDNTLREAADANYRFVPLFSPENVGTGADDKSVVYLGPSNQLYWAQATCNINGFRAYFKALNPASPAMKSVKRLVLGRRDMPTGIEQQVVSDQGQNGKFIRDGQLVIVRDGVEYDALGQRIK